VRYTGIFFGMLTLAFGMLFHSFLFKFYYLTGGDSGMRVARMDILGLDFARYNKIEFLAGPFYYYCLGLMTVAGLVMWRIVNSPFGLHLKAVRDNARKAEYLGVHVHRFRLAAFVISAAFGAVGGAILGFRVGLADPELVYWTQSGQLVFMAVLGGFSNFFGPIVGALTFTLLQDQLQSLTEYWRFVLGAILALIVIGFPEGIAGLAADLGRRIGWRTARPCCSKRAMSANPTVHSARSTRSAWPCTRASWSRSWGPTAPARRRWSICSPGCTRRAPGRSCSWARASPGWGRSCSPIMAWHARSSSSRFFPS
jgi:hypothetical protein